MKLQDDEVTIAYYALNIAKRQVESELEKNKSVDTDADYSVAEQELLDLNTLFDKLSAEKTRIGTHINPFIYFSNIFLPEI